MARHVLNRHLCALLCTAVFLTGSSAASASVVIDFEDGALGAGWTTGGNVAVSTDQAFEGGYSLFLGAGGSAVLSIPDHLKGGPVTVTMMVFDMGKWIDRSVPGFPASVHGPRWGVSAADGSTGVTIIERPALASAVGYGVQVPTEDRFAASWFSPAFYSGSAAIRENAPWLSDNGGTNPDPGEPASSTWQMGTPGEGAWLKATFDIATDGTVTVILEDVAREISREITRNIGGPVEEIWLWGGRNHATAGIPLAGVYVDDIRIIPEPAALGLLGIGGLLMLRRRA